MRVFWTPLARRRLAEIETYIAGHNSRAAREITKRLILRSKVLEQPPLLGRRLPQYPGDVREILQRPFRVIFRVTRARIEIVTVMHYRQLLPSDLAELRNGPAPQIADMGGTDARAKSGRRRRSRRLHG